MDEPNSSSTSSFADLFQDQYLLHCAAEQGDAEQIRQLLSKAKEPDRGQQEKEEGAQEKLQNDGNEGQENEENAMINLTSAMLVHDMDELDNYGATPLHLAILNGRLDCVQELIKLGADTQIPCDGNPLLHMALCQGDHPSRSQFALACTSILLASGCSPYDRDGQGRAALHWATNLNLVDVLNCILTMPEASTDQLEPGEKDMSEEPGLCRTDFSVEKASLLELQDRQGDTPLHLGARYACTDALKAILALDQEMDPGGALHTTNKQGYLPLHCAALSGDVRVAELLANYAPDTLHAVSRQSQTPLRVAEVRGHKDMAAYLHALMEGTPYTTRNQTSGSKPTYLIYSKEWLDHMTAPEPILRGISPPPENIKRLHVLAREGHGILRGKSFADAVWDENPPLAQLSDVLRVHSWSYVSKIQEICEALADEPSTVAQMDGDTMISKGSINAAVRAAGSVCKAVDLVVSEKAKNVFCIVRPPGHHAGPVGKVTCKNDMSGSSGFCLLNNIAIGAAYAINIYRETVKRVAILDFDVHHGNGTEACVKATQPSTRKVVLATPYSEGIQIFKECQPWLGTSDKHNLLFGSVQAYGQRFTMAETSWFYPGSGATSDNIPPSSNSALDSTHVVEDADGEFANDEDATNSGMILGNTCKDGPRVINIGIPGPGMNSSKWKRAWRDKMLPAVVNFNPDLIFLSAGFDAHKKDDINQRFVGLQEEHYEWITDQIVQVANRCCNGRIVSALEGGYRTHGENTSVFARSVAAHVTALMEQNPQEWNEHEANIDREAEKSARRKRKLEREALLEQENNTSLVDTEQQQGQGTDEAPQSSKRARPKVDYAKLNRELEEECKK